MYGSRRFTSDSLPPVHFLSWHTGDAFQCCSCQVLDALPASPPARLFVNPSQIPAAWTCAEKLLTLGLGAPGLTMQRREFVTVHFASLAAVVVGSEPHVIV